MKNDITNIMNYIFSTEYFTLEKGPKKMWYAIRIIFTMLIFSFFLWCGLFLPEKIFKDSTLKVWITIPVIVLVICIILFFMIESIITQPYFLFFSGLSFFVFISLLFGMIIGTSQSNTQSRNTNYQETIKALVILPIIFGIILPVGLYIKNANLLWENIFSLLFLFIISLIICIVTIIFIGKNTLNDKDTDQSLFSFKNSTDNFRFLQKYAFSSFAIWITMILTILIASPPYVDFVYYLPIIIIIILMIFFTIYGYKSNYTIGQTVEIYYNDKWRPRIIRDIVYKDGFTMSVYVEPNAEDEENLKTMAFSSKEVRLHP
jgi:hypothetical protein